MFHLCRLFIFLPYPTSEISTFGWRGWEDGRVVQVTFQKTLPSQLWFQPAAFEVTSQGLPLLNVSWWAAPALRGANPFEFPTLRRCHVAWGDHEFQSWHLLGDGLGGSWEQTLEGSGHKHRRLSSDAAMRGRGGGNSFSNYFTGHFWETYVNVWPS